MIIVLFIYLSIIIIFIVLFIFFWFFFVKPNGLKKECQHRVTYCFDMPKGNGNDLLKAKFV